MILANEELPESLNEIRNWLGLAGALVSHFFIFKGFGIASFLLPPFLFVLGYRIVYKKSIFPINTAFVFCAFFLLWISVLLGYIVINSDSGEWGFLSGEIGYSVAVLLNGLMGWGTLLLLLFLFSAFTIYFFNITALRSVNVNWPKVKKPSAPSGEDSASGYENELDNWPDRQEEKMEVDLRLTEPEEEDSLPLDIPQLDLDLPEPEPMAPVEKEPSPPQPVVPETAGTPESKPEPEFRIEEAKSTEKAVKSQENYDPTLDLASYKYPKLDLLNEHDTGRIQVTKEELEQNKDKIIETLVNFKIGISSIKATIGPTVTLYEIVPEAGIKISKIKNLEDDIALSLAALGIRIIAPIPGKGTIGIEVPNKNREIVGIRSVLGTNKFMHSTMELPVAIGEEEEEEEEKMRYIDVRTKVSKESYRHFPYTDMNIPFGNTGAL